MTTSNESERTDYRLPERQAPQQADSVVIKFSNDGLVLELEGDDVDLVSNYPRKVYSRSMRGETLEALGLHPQAMLFTQEMADE